MPESAPGSSRAPPTTVATLAVVGSTTVYALSWARVLHDTFVPHLSLQQSYVAGALALLGTTLTSYAYVWEILFYSGIAGGLRTPITLVFIMLIARDR